MVQFIFEGSRTNLIFWSKFAYVLVRTGVYSSHSREAALITFLGLENLTNKVKGTFYDGNQTWSGEKNQKLWSSLGLWFI